MKAHQLIEDVRAIGCSIEVDGSNLVIAVADRALSAELIAELRPHKAGLIAALSGGSEADEALRT